MSYPVPPTAFPDDAFPSPVAQPLPTFCLIVFIVDLVLCSLRLLMVPFSILGLMFAEDVEQVFGASVFAEILAGLLIGVIGIAANVMLLVKKPLGVHLGNALVALTVASYGVAVWQTVLQFGMLDSTAERVGGVIGFVVVMAVRVTLLALFVVALMKFKRWMETREHQQAEPVGFGG